MNEVSNSAHSPERRLLHGMRAYNDSLLDQGDEGRANSLALQAALDAYHAMAGAEPAQPVEAVDVATGDLERALLDQIRIITQQRDDARAALAHPRPTGATNEVSSDAGKHRMDRSANRGGELRKPRRDAVHDHAKAEIANADLIAFLDDLRGRYAAAEDECACDFVTRAIRALSAPTGGQAGEVMAYFDPDTSELHSAGHIHWSRKNGVDVSGLVPLGRMEGSRK